MRSVFTPENRAISRECGELQAEDQRLRAELGVTRVLATVQSISVAAPPILKALCEVFPAQVAGLWLVEPDEQEMRCVATHCCEETPELQEFAAAGRQLRVRPGASLPGRVWVARRASWVPELSRDPNFCRAEMAAAAGLRCAAAFPLVAGEEIFGVTEFFARQNCMPDRSIQDMLAALGLEIGRFIERERAQEEHRRLAALVQSSSEAIVSLTLEDKVTSWNQGAERLYGYPRAEVIGQSIMLIIPPEQRAQTLAHLERVRAGEHIRNLRAERVRKDGRRVWAAVALSPILGAAGQPTGVSCIARDITQEIAQEEMASRNQALERENQRVGSASQMKSEFLASLSHELRTALNGIIGFSEFLSDGKAGELNARQHEYLGDILSSGRHVLQLLNNILDLSKVEAGKMELWPEMFSLARAIHEAVAVVHPLAMRRDIAIHCRVEIEPPWVTLDQVKFKQVLYNLVSNAVKFNHEKGIIEVIAIPLNASDFQLTVRDTGIGMNPEEIRSLFREFHQMRTGIHTLDSTGLGLALTRKLVELMHGAIQVESVPGQGSTFTVRLPRDLAPAQEAFSAQRS